MPPIHAIGSDGLYPNISLLVDGAELEVELEAMIRAGDFWLAEDRKTRMKNRAEDDATVQSSVGKDTKGSAPYV